MNMLEYIRGIAIFIIVESIILGVVNNEDYRKLIKICSGMVLVILILAPINNVLGFSDTILGYFNKNINNNQVEELRNSISLSVDKIEEDSVKAQYEELINQQLSPFVETQGFVILQVQVIFDENKENYIGQIIVIISEKDKKAESSTDINKKIEDVEKIEISVGNKIKENQDDPVLMTIKNKIIDMYGISYEKITVRRIV